MIVGTVVDATAGGGGARGAGVLRTTTVGGAGCCDGIWITKGTCEMRQYKSILDTNRGQTNGDGDRPGAWG